MFEKNIKILNSIKCIDVFTKNVLITGGTKGIGNAIANLFYNEGAKTFITGTANKANKFKKFNYINATF